MDLIYQNPFRVLGLPVTATDREIAKQIDDLSIYTDMGKPIEYDSDNFFPVKPVRTPESIQEAKQKIDQPNNKLFHASFWFWEDSNNVVDEMAFEELKNGNPKKAIEFWERETGKLWENEKGEGINSQNKSNYKNISIVQLGLSIENKKLQKNHFLNGLSFSGTFLANGYFEEFSKGVLGAKHSVEVLEITNRHADEIINIVNPHIGKRKSENKVTKKELLDHFKYFPDSTQGNIIEKFTTKYIHNIEVEIEKAEQFRKDDKSIANKAGFELHKQTKEDVKELQAVLSSADLIYKIIADKLAEELSACSIAYFNELRDTDIDPGKDALKLAKYAKKIAIDDQIKDRINEGIPIIEEYINSKPVRGIIKPLLNKLEEYREETESVSSDEKYRLSKEFVFGIKSELDSLRVMLKREDSNFNSIKEIITWCAGTVNARSVDIANYGGNYGRSIELLDMARRILLYESSNGENYTLDKELSDQFARGRKVLSNNISNQDLGFTSLLLGGGIRMAKKRVSCGCGSGLSQNKCCSV